MTTFIVNGKSKTLEMRVNGIDISADFIGNTCHDMAQDDEGNYIATAADFAWWKRVIASHMDMARTIARYKTKNDPDEVDRVVQDWIDVDLEYQPAQVRLGLKRNFG